MVLFGSTLLNREIPLKRSRIGGQKNQLPKGREKCCLDGRQSCDPGKTYGLVSLVFLQCKPHADMGKARVILCVYYGQYHTKVAKPVTLTLPCKH